MTDERRNIWEDVDRGESERELNANTDENGIESLNTWKLPSQ